MHIFGGIVDSGRSSGSDELIKRLWGSVTVRAVYAPELSERLRVDDVAVGTKQDSYRREVKRFRCGCQ